MASKTIRDPSVQNLFSFLRNNRDKKQTLHVFFRDDIAYKFEIYFIQYGRTFKVMVPKSPEIIKLYEEINNKRDFYFGNCSEDIQKRANKLLQDFDTQKEFSLNQIITTFVGPIHHKNQRYHSYNSNKHFMLSVEELQNQGLSDLAQFAIENGQLEYISLKDLASYFEETGMTSENCWLMTFNPLNPDYEYTIDDWAALISQIPNAMDSWSTGGTKSLQEGDVVYFLRQGKKAGNDQRGIVGKGEVISEVYVDEQNKARVDIRLDKGMTTPPEMLSVRRLQEVFPDYHWTSQGNGNSIPEDIVEYLEDGFAELDGSLSNSPKEDIGDILQELLTGLKALPDFDVFAFANSVDLATTLLKKDLAVQTKTFDTLKERWEDRNIGFNFYIQNKSTSGKSLDGQTLTYERRKQFFEQMRPILERYHFKVEGIYNKTISYPHELIVGFPHNELPELDAQFGASSHHMFLTISGRRGGQRLIPDIRFTAEKSVNSSQTKKVLPKPSKETIGRIERLQYFKNLVLEGVPGTGKTFALSAIKLHWYSQTQRQIFEDNDELSPFAMTFHPSTSYEDFVEGLRPLTALDKKGLLDENHTDAVWFYDKLASSKGNWGIKDGFFLKVCQRAILHPNHDFIIFLDELNRANIPKVFGDLITTIERSKRAIWEGTQDDNGEINLNDWSTDKCQIVELPYSGRKFFVPENVYIVATQNTTDRSVAPLDAALRRRFAFLRMNPDSLKTIQKNISAESFTSSLVVWYKINQVLQQEIGPDAVLGHSYFYVVYNEVRNTSEDEQYSALRFVWEQELLPQLVDTLQSADRLDILEDFRDLFDDIDPRYRFTIEISGEALYRLPIISIEEKEIEEEVSITTIQTELP